jgi:ferrous iron transport protein B
MGARIVDSPKARLLTIMVSPLVPCTARMAVVAILAPIFFGSAAIWVSWGMIALSLVVLAIVGIALHELALGGEHVAFIMELPLYHVPNARTIGLSVWQRTVSFVKKAGTIILIVSVIVWALSVLPNGEVESSVLAAIGKFLAPAGALLGVGWRMMVALLTSFVAKENTIATLGVLFGTGGTGAGLAQVLPTVLTPASALAFLAVQVLFIPCSATVATIRQETGSWRWTLLNVGLLLVISFGVGIAIYQVARLIGWGV